MHTDPNCIFCKIVVGQIPSYKVYEDENLFGFLTNKPHTKGHMLLIPKEHTLDILTSSDETSNQLFSVGKKIAKKVKSILNPDKVGFVLAGQGVPHLHLHLIPMNHESDLDHSSARDLNIEEAEEILKKYKF